MKENIHIFYSNDLHSNFENWPKITHFMKKQRDLYKEKQEEFYLVDIGDHVDRSHPIAEAFKGKVNVQLLNKAGYDIATIGNNEGITLEYQDLFHLYDEASFQVTCANLSAKNEPQPTWLQTKITKVTRTGIRITFFGLTAPFRPYYEPLGWEIRSAHDYLRDNVMNLKENSDILVFLSHLGLPDDQVIAEQFPEIDVIIGGHTHHVLKKNNTHNGVLMTAAGKFGNYVGEVHLTWDHELNQIDKKEAIVNETDSLSKDRATMEYIHQWNNKAMEVLRTPIATLEQELEVDWFKPTPIIELLTNRLREWVDADIAMLNAGLLLESLPKGTITYGDIHRICPHPINPCCIELRGIEIVEIVRGAFDPKLIHFELIGFGFRGKVLGKFVFSGLDITTNIGDDGRERVQDICFQNQPLDMEATYRFVTADTFIFGQMFPEIVRSNKKKLYLPEFLRDILADALKNIDK